MPTSPYVFLPEFLPLSELEPWEGNLGIFTHVFGHSLLGHLFLWSGQDGGRYGMAHPYQKGFKDYGPFPSPADFQRQILEDAYVRMVIFREQGLAELEQRLGPAGPGQVYMPVPYEILGGSGALDTYDKGDLAVWASIVGQVHGLTARPSA